MGENVEKSITIIQYIIFCLNVITWLVAVVIIGLCLWVRLDEDIQDWVESLEIQRFYIGLYILMVSSSLFMIIGFFSCIATFSNENKGRNTSLLSINVIAQLLLFIIGLIGAAVLMDNSTYRSSIGPVIKKVMLRLINLYPSYGEATEKLSRLQENIGCCGADGPDDYITLRRALPTECRDTVTGNAFFYGCSDQLTWILEKRSYWITGLAILLCANKIMNAVLSTILVQLIQKRGNQSS